MRGPYISTQVVSATRLKVPAEMNIGVSAALSGVVDRDVAGGSEVGTEADLLAAQG